jgi:1-acyl-sn-glycerol-3-phosphate acyltransferase
MMARRGVGSFERAAIRIGLGRLWGGSTLHTIFRIAIAMFEKYLRHETNSASRSKIAGIDPARTAPAAMQLIRSKAFDAFVAAWTLIMSPSCIVLWLCGTPRHALRAVSQFWAKGILWGLSHIVGLRHVERGRENIPNEPCLIIANHQSAWETVALAVLFPATSFVAKQETARIPIVGWFLKNYPMIMVDRGGGGNAIRQLIADSRAVLAEGRSVIIFPEGTRKSTSERVVFKRGAEVLYAELNTPILPIALNSGVFWTRDGSKCRGTITLSYLPPILPGLSGEEFREKAQALLEMERDRLVRESAARPALETVG